MLLEIILTEQKVLLAIFDDWKALESRFPTISATSAKITRHS
jgi:hypothetical protein